MLKAKCAIDSGITDKFQEEEKKHRKKLNVEKKHKDSQARANRTPSPEVSCW